MYEGLFNSLVATIRGWIQDKIDSIHDHHAETLEARDDTVGYRNDAALSASNAATSEANAANAVEDRVNQLIADAPEAMDTLSELADALGNDPNFATTVATQIGERAKTSDVNAALFGKADSGAENTAQWGQVSGKPSAFPADWAGVNGKPETFPPSSHTHAPGDVSGLDLTETNTGINTTTTATGGTAVGVNATATGNYPVAVGYGSTAASYCSAFGNSANASGTSATAFGRSSSATATGGTALGFSAGVTQASGTAVGRAAKANHASSTAVGYGAQTSKANQVMLGTASEEVTVPGTLTVAGRAVTGSVTLTQSAYDALATKDPDTTYNIVAG